MPEPENNMDATKNAKQEQGLDSGSPAAKHTRLLMEKSKFIGIKLKGINHWFWFLRENTSVEFGCFTATNGWGLESELTDLEVDESLIEGRIFSPTAQIE